MTVGEKIQFYRKRIRLSQEELGRQLLVSRQTVSLWEMDKTLPTVDNLLRLKEIFGVSVDDILSYEPPALENTPEQATEVYAEAEPQQPCAAPVKEPVPQKMLSVQLFIHSLIALLLGFAAVALLTAGEWKAATKQAWLLFLFLPIPLSSTLIGLFYLRRRSFPYKKNLIAGIVAAAILFLGGSSYFLPGTWFEPPPEPVGPMQAATVKLVEESHPIVVDGKLDEAYIDATPLILDTCRIPGSTKTNGVARFVWSPSENAIYCFVIINDADVGPAKYDLAQLCVVPWRGDTVELFVDFEESGTVPAGGWGLNVGEGLPYERGVQYRIDGYTGDPSCLLQEEPECFQTKFLNWLHPESGQPANVFNGTYYQNKLTHNWENMLDSAMAEYFGWEWSADETKIGWGSQRTAYGYTAEFRIECKARTLQVGEKVFFDIQVNDMNQAARSSPYDLSQSLFYSSALRRESSSALKSAIRARYDWLVLSNELAPNGRIFEVSDEKMNEMGMAPLS